MAFQILLVDDYEDFRRFVCSKLQLRPDFHVSQASDGLEAVRKTQELQPDLILLDIGLPELDGLEVARRVRNLAPRSKILFLSQESDPDVIRQALSLGAFGYVVKSQAETDLLPAIEAALNSHKPLQQ